MAILERTLTGDFTTILTELDAVVKPVSYTHLTLPTT